MTECNGGYACAAPEHIEGCFTGEGDPYAVTGLYIGKLREALTELADLAAFAVCEPRLFAENEDHAQQRLGQSLSRARLLVRSGALPRTDQTKETT